MLTKQKWNFKVVFNRSCCHGNYENVKFYLSIKIFYQCIFHLPSFSLWAATFLLPWLANDTYSQTAKTVFRHLNWAGAIMESRKAARSKAVASPPWPRPSGSAPCPCCSFIQKMGSALPLSYILRDPGAVSRVHKMFVVNVYCKIETSASRSYSKQSPRTFYPPD